MIVYCSKAVVRLQAMAVYRESVVILHLGDSIKEWVAVVEASCRCARRGRRRHVSRICWWNEVTLTEWPWTLKEPIGRDV